LIYFHCVAGKLSFCFSPVFLLHFVTKPSSFFSVVFQCLPAPPSIAFPFASGNPEAVSFFLCPLQIFTLLIFLVFRNMAPASSTPSPRSFILLCCLLPRSFRATLPKSPLLFFFFSFRTASAHFLIMKRFLVPSTRPITSRVFSPSFADRHIPSPLESYLPPLFSYLRLLESYHMNLGVDFICRGSYGRDGILGHSFFSFSGSWETALFFSDPFLDCLPSVPTNPQSFHPNFFPCLRSS